MNERWIHSTLLKNKNICCHVSRLKSYFFWNLTWEWDNYLCVDLGLSCSVWLMYLCTDKTPFSYLAFSCLNSFWDACVGMLPFVAIFSVWSKCCLIEVLTLVPMVSGDRQLLGMPGWTDFSRGSTTTRNPVGQVIETDWSKERLEVMPFIPTSEGLLLLYTFGIVGVCLLAFFRFGYKPSCLGALEPWLDHQLGLPSFFLVTVSKNLPEVRDLNSKEVPHYSTSSRNHFTSKMVSWASGGNREYLL